MSNYRYQGEVDVPRRAPAVLIGSRYGRAFFVVGRRGPLVVIRTQHSFGTPAMLWIRSTVRRNHDCAVTGAVIPPGAAVYKPIREISGYHDRITAAVVEAAAARWDDVARRRRPSSEPGST